MGRASIYTLLALDRWAKIMGIAGPYFNQSVGATVFPAIGNCDAVWYQHDWQKNNQVSRETLALAIDSAEDDIANYIGYWPAPKWIAKEMHSYPRPYRKTNYGGGLDVRGMHKTIKTDFAKVVQMGARALTLIDTPTVVYSDPDGDGFDELATVTAATTLTDATEINVYFEDKDGQQEWEIRPAKTKAITGGNFVGTFDSWLFIDPDDWEVFPTTTDIVPVVLDSSNFVTDVDVYREYIDTSVRTTELQWNPIEARFPPTFCCTSCGGSGCAVCANTTQDGCAHIRDVDLGLVAPIAATYDTANTQWNEVAFAECREPDLVKLWYYAGDLSSKFLREYSHERLSDFFAQAIAWMAAARLGKEVCGCDIVSKRINGYRDDLAFFDPNQGNWAMDEDILANPFGTRRGEVMAWQRISKLTEVVGTGATV